MTTKIGVIGLGAMGALYARHLLKAGYVVVGCDLDPAHEAALEKEGGEVAVAQGSRRQGRDPDRPFSLAALETVIGGRMVSFMAARKVKF